MHVCANDRAESVENGKFRLEFLQTSRRIARNVKGETRRRGGREIAATMRVASSKTSSQLWRIGEGGDSCLGTVRDSACGELLNCLVIESDRLLTM